jgi:hypothetical protein
MPSGHSFTSDVRAGLLADKIIKVMAVSRMDNISPRWFAFFSGPNPTIQQHPTVRSGSEKMPE